MKPRTGQITPGNLVAVFLGFALLMTVFEGVKNALFSDDITLWTSHLITIVFTSIAATVTAIIVSRKVSSLARQTEAVQARASAFQNALFDALPVAIFYKDRHGRFLGCNAHFEEIMGIGQGDILGKTAAELWPGELSSMYHQKDLELMGNPSPQQYDYSIKDKHGQIRDAHFSKDVFRDEHGEVAGIIGTFSDITETKRALRTITESEAKYHTLFETANDGIFIQDEIGRAHV
jgi:PAS domain S-box-containing protein